MKKIYVLIFWCLLFSKIYATHMLGGSITYKYLGGKKYEITAILYRDCRGIPLNGPNFSVFSDNVSPISLNYTRTKIQDVSNRCKDTGNGPCYPQNTTSGAGLEEHTFVANIDFNVSPYKALIQNNCQVYFEIDQCCRNGSILTLSTGNGYVESMLDVCNSNFKNNSPQLYAYNKMYLNCNSKFANVFGGYEFAEFDSLSIELVTPLTAHNTKETYNGNFKPTIPMTPFCPPNPGTLNCTPSPNTKPPKGFYFNKNTSEIIFTPTACDEVAVFCIKINEYRKDSSGKWKLIGYVMREMLEVVKQNSDINLQPEINFTNNQLNYNFKVRQKTCFDITTFDDTLKNQSNLNRGEKTKLSILNLPPGATFKIKDTTAQLQSGEFCWQIPDSIYQKDKRMLKSIAITARVKDNYCLFPEVLDKTFIINMSPLDSVGTVNITTFEDLNKNTKKDNNEKGYAKNVLTEDILGSEYYTTNSNGEVKAKLYKGNSKITLLPGPYHTIISKDTNLNIQYDSNYNVELGFTKNTGIYGKIYKDENSNCKFDFGEDVLKGYKVFTDSNKYVGISDENGIYYINCPKGTYNLSCNFKPFEYQVTCPSNNIINLNCAKDSAYENNDFAIDVNTNFTDIEVITQMQRARRGNTASVIVYCRNNGYKTRKNIRINLQFSKFSNQFNNTLFKSLSNDSSWFKIDSIEAQSYIAKQFNYTVNVDSFNVGDHIYSYSFLDSSFSVSDSIIDNNFYQTYTTVVGPYDPNNKLIERDTFKTIFDKTINYTINFENKGTDTAFSVLVIDTIDLKYHSLAEFKLNWSTHNCVPVFNGNAIYFKLDNIQLPYRSLSGNKSTGAINFTLGLKSNITTEQTFTNKAAIYFDYEKPVFTAPAIGNIVSPVSIVKLNKQSSCINQENTLHFESKIPLNTGNQMILEMSDANGDFTNAIVLKMQNSSLLKDSINFTLPQNTAANNYKLRLRTTNPSSTSIAGSGIIDISTIKAANFSLTSNLNNNEICEKDSFKIAFNNANNQYQVLKNNVADNSLDFNTQYATQISLNDAFKIIMKDGLNNCSDTMSIKPLVNPLPTANFSLAPASICPYDSVLLSIDSNYLTDVAKFKALLYSKTNLKKIWFKNLSNNDEFSIKSYSDKGCSNTSAYQKVTVYNLPNKPIITANGNSLSVTSTDSIKWYRDNTLIADNVNDINNASTGNYYVQAKNANGCYVLSDNYMHQYTAISSIKFSPYKIYPNPANDFLQLENVKDINITLNSIDGKEILSINNTQNSVKLTLDNIPNGLYMLKLTSANHQQYSQLINVVH